MRFCLPSSLAGGALVGTTLNKRGPESKPYVAGRNMYILPYTLALPSSKTRCCHEAVDAACFSSFPAHTIAWSWGWRWRRWWCCAAAAQKALTPSTWSKIYFHTLYQITTLHHPGYRVPGFVSSSGNLSRWWLSIFPNDFSTTGTRGGAVWVRPLLTQQPGFAILSYAKQGTVLPKETHFDGIPNRMHTPYICVCVCLYAPGLLVLCISLCSR